MLSAKEIRAKAKRNRFATEAEAVEILTAMGYQAFLGGYIRGRGCPAFIKPYAGGGFYVHINKSRG